MIGRVQVHVAGLIEEARQPLFIRQVLWLIAFAVFMVVTLYFNIQLMKSLYPNPPTPPDLILDQIPQNSAFIFIGEVLSLIQVSLAALFIFSARQRFRQLPVLMFFLILMYLIRGFTIILTPLGQIQPPSRNFSEDHIIAQTFYHGMFFSGHTASAVIQVMFFHRFKIRNIHLSWFLLPWTVGQVISLLVSHQHYTIDIFGAIFVAYFITHFDFMMIVPPALRNVSWLPWQAQDHPTLEREAVPVYSNGHHANGHSNGNAHGMEEHEEVPEHEFERI